MGSTDGNIRKAAAADLPRLTEIYNQAILGRQSTCDTEPLSVEQRRQWFKEHQTDRFPLWVYETDGKAVGYAYLSPYRGGRSAVRDVCEISYYIDFHYHGRGIGSRLMAHAVKEAQQRGFKHMIALLLSCNAASIALLKKFDFAEWGAMPEIAQFEEAEYSHLYYGKKL
jgi:L-amino acid N-acyltransferase YncA